MQTDRRAKVHNVYVLDKGEGMGGQLGLDVRAQAGDGPGAVARDQETRGNLAVEDLDGLTAVGARPRRIGLPFFLSLVLAGVLLLLAVRGVDWRAVQATIRHARPDILAPAFAVLILSFMLRAVRWRVLLQAKTGLPLPIVFSATAVGYLGNSFVPARAGELIRSALIARRAAISIAYVVATALLERITDVMALVLVGLGATFFLQGMPGWLVSAVRGMALLGLGGMGCICVVPHLKSHLREVVRGLPLSRARQERVATLLEQFSLGLLSLRRPGCLGKFAALTAAIWLNDGLFAMTVAWALHLSLTLPQALVLLVGLGLSSAAPSTPGYVGIYQFVAVHVLMPFSFSRSQALGYIITYQGMLYVAVTVLGLVGLWRLQGVQPAGTGVPCRAGVVGSTARLLRSGGERLRVIGSRAHN